MQQVTLNFDAGLTDGHPTCRDYVAHRAQRQKREDGKPYYLKDIAADMDYAPSQLTRKLANGRESTDSARFTLDDLEQFMDETGDKSPVLYLVEKYLVESEGEIEELERKLALLKQQKSFEERLMKESQ